MPELRRVKGYEGRYLIDEEGNIFSLPSNKQMRVSTNKDGYKQITLYQNNTSKTFRINRLVAEAFIPNPDNLLEVHHKNEIKVDNHKDNLEWTTRSGNMEYSFAKEYSLINPDGEVITFTNMNRFCRENDLNIGHVYRVRMGQRKSTKGWRNVPT